MTDPLRSRLERLLVLMQATIGAAREYAPDAPTNREVVLATMQGWADELAALLREPPERALTFEQAFRVSTLVTALEVRGFGALPCATCHRTGEIGVHELHDLLAALLREPPEATPLALREKFCEAHLREILQEGSHYSYDAEDRRRSVDGIGGCAICKGERLEMEVGLLRVAAARAAAPAEEN